MRSTINRKSLAVAYGLGILWTAAVVGGAFVLAPPMLELYRNLGIESVTVHIMATMALDLVFASTVTIAAGLAVRALASHAPRFRAAPRPEVATHHA